MAVSKFSKADRVINRLINEGLRDFAIFPFGERGMMVKDILNLRYGIKEKYIIDNVSRGGTLSLEEFSKVYTENIMILLASDAENVYSELRFELMKWFDVSKFVDIFSESMFFDPDVYFELMPLSRRVGNKVLHGLDCCAKEIYRNGVIGAVAECGVFHGHFANWISRLFPERRIYLCDTFSGFDSRDIDDKERVYSDGINHTYGYHAFDNNSVEMALRNIGYRKNACVYAGYFPESVVGKPEIENESFAFVHLDTDLYKPILSGLEFFYPRLSPGGYIFIHDLYTKVNLGVREAVIDFCRANSIGYSYLPVNWGVISKPLVN